MLNLNGRVMAISSRSRRTSDIQHYSNMSVHHEKLRLTEGMFKNHILVAYLDMSYNNILDIPNGTFLGLGNLLNLNLGYNLIYKLIAKQFTGLDRLRALNLKGNPLAKIENFAFFGLTSLPKLDLSNMKLTKLANNVFNGLHVQELNISHNKIKVGDQKRFFYEMDDLKRLYSDKYYFCCLANERRISEPLDECTPSPDAFSSCTDLMKNQILTLCMWILGISALLGNGFVVFWRLREKTERQKSHSFMILNLGCADFLMGFYMMIIASVDIYYKGEYSIHNEYWRHSPLCNFSGIISTISMEERLLWGVLGEFVLLVG
ncbi:uncharacterized protein LOC144448141 [Glandiceps talaboti]